MPRRHRRPTRPGRPIHDRRVRTGLIGRRRPGGPNRPRFVDWADPTPIRGCWHRRLPTGEVLIVRPAVTPAATSGATAAPARAGATAPGGQPWGR
jgi:hypothetical protein